MATKKETKECPFCGEEILATAKKCKHCGEMLKTEEEIEKEKNFKPIIYGKNAFVKVLTIIIWGLFSLSFLISGFALSSVSNQQHRQTEEITEGTGENSEGTGEIAEEQTSTKSENSNGGLFILIGLCFLIPIRQMFMKKLIIDKDHVTIKSGIIFKHKEDIKYNKINNIQQSSFLGFGGIKLFTGNDKPVVFDNLEKYEEVIEFINKKIDKQY